jgi:hypothetical protein
MCGYVVIAGVTYDGSQCTNTPVASYNVIHRRLQPDDIAGAQFLYGAALQDSASDGPMPLWAYGALGAALLFFGTRRVRRRATR